MHLVAGPMRRYDAPMRFACLSLSIACACGGAGVAPDAGSAEAGPIDAGVRDAGPPLPRRDAGTPLPMPSEVLPSASYDCRAGAVVAPPRPYEGACHRDVACTERLVAAHRMAVPFAPENSLSALRAAILLGVDMVETDIRLTADGAVVFVHDGTIDRTVEGTGDVEALTLAELTALPLRVPDTIPSGDFACERVPTLDDVFAVSRGQIVVELEVKDTAAGVVAAEYLRDHDLYDEAFLLCGRGECEAVRAAVPDVPIMPRATDAAEVLRELDYDPPPILVHVDVTDELLDPDLVERVHAAGARVYANAFTNADVQAAGLGDLSGYRVPYERGVDVLQTQFPHWALRALDR